MIDILFAILIVAAIIKGFQKGLLFAIFSILAFIIGLAAALKLSATVAVYLQHNMQTAGKWLPAISFFLVFTAVVIIVHLSGKLIETTFEMAMLGWANKIGGILLYIILYTIIFSIFLFFAEKIQILSQSALQQSVVYPFIKPWGPKAFNCIGTVIPLFKDSFAQLEAFFAGIANKM